MATKHTLKDRYQAAASLIATGNSIAASRESGVPASTIRHWQHKDEDFQLVCQELQAEFADKIKFKLAEIINEAADQTLDRLTNGDVVRDNRTGELVRVPIKGKDAAIVGAVAFDKLRLVENQPTTISSTSGDLKALAEEFAQLSRDHRNSVVSTQECEDFN